MLNNRRMKPLAKDGSFLFSARRNKLALKLQVIIGSTRPTRRGPIVAKWFADFAKQHGKFDVELVDIADFKFPVYDEPKHPATGQYEHEHTKRWSAKIKSADAFVFVHPEYNYFAPPALVNALDYVFAEWNYKPAGLVSYGGISGGLRAAQALKLIVTTLKMVPLSEGVPVPNFNSMIGKDDVFAPTDPVKEGSTKMLDELLRWAEALKPMRK